MSTQVLISQCDLINRVFAAFFINECITKEGINFTDSRPQAPQIARLNENGNYFLETDCPYGLKRFFHGKVFIDFLNLEVLREDGIAKFMKHVKKDKISDVARYFANEVRSYKYCDFVFSSLPEIENFIYSCIHDPEENFRSRLIMTADTSTKCYQAQWEFSCLLMDKLREVDDHPIYGKSYKSVDHMTDEERLKFNKQPE